jgi:Glycosyl hydrolase family 26
VLTPSVPKVLLIGTVKHAVQSTVANLAAQAVSKKMEDTGKFCTLFVYIRHVSTLMFIYCAHCRECCTDGVKQKNRQCSWTDAPCTLSASASDPLLQQTSVRRPVSIAILPGDPNKDIWSRMNKYGARVDSILIYQNANYLSWPYIKSFLDAGFKVQLTIEFWDTYPNLWAIAGGRFDWKLTDFFNKVRADGRRISVRLLHEHNGDWYNWGALAGGSNSFEAYKQAFRRVSGVIRRTGANVAILAQYNSLNAKGDRTGFAAQYPGDEYVDGICISSYNFCGVSNWQVRSLSDVISPWYNEMTAITSKPLCIGEMSSTNNCGGKEAWLRSAWNDLAYKFPRINIVTFFFQNKWHIKEDFDLNNWGEIDAWKDGMWSFKNAVGYTAGDIGVTSQQESDATRAQKLYEQELQKRGLNVTTTVDIEKSTAKTANIEKADEVYP